MVKLILQHACFVNSTLKVPGCKNFGGELLDINYKNGTEINKQEIMKDAPIFGLSWLHDGATTSRMPLINTLAMCDNVPATCVAIKHLVTRDAPYIASLPEDTAMKY